MENKQMKCVKGKSCLHCGSNYCRYVEEVNQLKTDVEQMTALKDTYFACYHAKHGDLADKYEQSKEQLEAYKMEAEEGKEINAELKAENESLENQLKSEKERFEKQDKFAAMYIQELKNEKSSLIKEYLEKIGQLQSENESLKQHQEKVFENWANITNTKDALIKDLQQKIKELTKDDIKRELLNALEDVESLRAGRNNWRDNHRYLFTQNMKLKSTLKDLRIIAKEWYQHWVSDSDVRMGFEQILQKISEVENDNV